MRKILILSLSVLLLASSCAPAPINANPMETYPQIAAPASDPAISANLQRYLDNGGIEELVTQAYGGYINLDDWTDVGPVNKGIYFQNQETGRISLSTGGAPGLSAPVSSGKFDYCLPDSGVMEINLNPYDLGTTVIVTLKDKNMTVIPNLGQFPDALIVDYTEIGKVGIPRGSVSFQASTVNYKPPVGNSELRFFVKGFFDGSFGRPDYKGLGTYALLIYLDQCQVEVPGGSTLGACTPCFSYEVK